MPDPIRVLVIDDDAAVKTSLHAFLEDEGFHVRSTGSPTEALEILSKHPINVAIVDIRLPGMDGQSLILRACQVQPATRYLIYTGSVAYTPPDALAQVGMSPGDVFHKPVSSMTLIADAVRRLHQSNQ